jgi:hypothetical protein
MEIVMTYVRKHGREQLYDGLLVPALVHMRTALGQAELAEGEEHRIVDLMKWILDDVDTVEVPQSVHEKSDRHGVRTRLRMVSCAARDEIDRLSLEMLRQLLDAARWDVEVVPALVLAGELASLIEEKQPAVLCIGSLPPGGLAHTRYLCKRLRVRFPDLKILVGRWLEASAADAKHDPLLEAGADKVRTTLLQAREQLQAWLPVLEGGAAASGNGSPSSVQTRRAV